MADDGILPLLFLGGAGYLLWKHFQQTPATSPAVASTAGSSSLSSILYSPLAEQTPAKQIIPPPAPPLQSYAAAPGAGSGAASASSPFALFNFGTTPTFSQPGANAPDPSIYRASAADVARDVTNISASLAAGTVADGPGTIDLSCYHKCYTTWGNPIAGCICDGSTTPVTGF